MDLDQLLLTDQEETFDILDKNLEYVMDATDNDNLSICCGAPIVMYSYCKDCGENV